MNFCESLRQHAIRLTNYKNKKKTSYYKTNSGNHMKMPKSVIFVKKSLKLNMLKIKRL